MTLLLQDIIDIIESVAPLSAQEEWDNSGLQIGRRDADITSVLLCTDVTEAVIDEAIARGCELVVSHHPLLFHGLKTIQGNTFQERVAEKAIRASVAVYSSHTAIDVQLHGVSGKMAEKLGIADYCILSPTGKEAGKQGTERQGMGQPEAKPIGLGVIGNLPHALSPEAFLQQVKQVFHVPAIRYTAAAAKEIQRVAMCGGAGADFIEDAIRQGADAFISADFRHHEFLQADGRIMVLDIGHFESEQHTKEIFAEILDGNGIIVTFAEADKSPVKAY